MANLYQQGMGLAGPTSNFYTTPFPQRPGDRARDANGNEYVFCDFDATVYYGQIVRITSNFLATPLLGTARVASRVGIVMAGDATTNSNPTSDNGGWVQIYGIHINAQTGSASDGLVSDQTVDYFLVPQASVGTPSGTFSVITAAAGTSIAQTSTDPNRIWGMWLVPAAEVSTLTTAPSSAVSGPATDLGDDFPTSATVASFDNTSAFSGQTHVVFLNYPYVTGLPEPIGVAAS